jgi:hypothetical protein
MEAQMHTQQQESARLLSDSEAEVRRLRKALDEAVASKEALREKSAMELRDKQRVAEEAQERHLAQERRLLSEIDRERMATRQVTAELAKVQKAHAADAETASAALVGAQQALQHEKNAHSDAAAAWSLQHQAAQVELATLRERAAGADLRATDLASQLQRLRVQSEREITQLRESHASATAALREPEGPVGKGAAVTPRRISRKSPK